MSDPDDDPVLRRRARAGRLAGLGQRIGYGLLALAVALFLVGFAVGFSSGVVSAVVAALVAGSLVLAPAIVVGYGVRAAEREDREREA